MKTDNVAFFEFSLEQFAAEGFEVIRQTRDLGRSPYAAGNIMTEYERSFTERGVPVCMAEAVLSKNA
jgi:tRNA (guanine-N7-)-methyltransferase